MTKVWQPAVDLHEATVAAYSTAGVALTDAEVANNGIVITQNADGSIAVTAAIASIDFYVRVTPNYGNGVGSSAARLDITAAAEIDSGAPRWDGGGTWGAFNGPATLAEPETADWTYIEVPVFPDGVGVPSVAFLMEVFFDELATASFNCTCIDEAGTGYQTLLQMRQRLMTRLGFGNQLANPPPGVALLMDSFLQDAQVLIYNRAQWLVEERYFSWPLLNGVRLYDIRENAEPCSAKLNPDKITWAGIVREGIWYTLVAGIAPPLNGYLTTAGYPVYYAVRACIEVWPKPDITEGSLVIKGNFGLLPFTEDTDRATIDDNLIFMLALGNAKAHYRQPDADRYIQQGEVLLNNLVAGTHNTKRYVPGRSRDVDLVYVQPTPSVPFTS